MPHVPSAALAVDLQPVPLAITARTLNTLGVALLTIAIGIIACIVGSTTLGRTALGLICATAMIASGDLLSRREDHFWWFGTSVVGCGYALAYFMAHATFYIPGIVGLANPYVCWLSELCLVAVVTLHANRNSMLRWLALPFALYVSGTVMLSALASAESLSLAGLTVTVPALACVCGMAWWSLLSFAYTRLEKNYPTLGDSFENKAPRWLYRVASELFFVLSVISAMSMPQYLASLEYAPLGWSLEMPVLLAICWRNKTFIKPMLIMGVWSLSAALTLYTHMEVNMLVSMSVPASGLLMALAHRRENPSWSRWQRLTGYSVYLYGSAVVAAAVPFLHLATLEALPYWLVEAGVLLGLGLYLRDKALERFACVFSVGALVAYGLQWQHWYASLTAMVVIGCYGMVVVFGRIAKAGGLLQADFATLPGKYTLTATEARILELCAAGIGYASLMTGILLLLSGKITSGEISEGFFAEWFYWIQVYVALNTAAWAASAIALVAFGLLANKLEHRFCGVIALAAACYKLCVVDLSGSESMTRAFVSTIAVAICCIAAGSLYLATSKRMDNSAPRPKRGDDDEPPSPEGH
jgi:hypothetical protein